LAVLHGRWLLWRVTLFQSTRTRTVRQEMDAGSAIRVGR